jgi:nitrate/nitrite-specific signal transduction histidine kinase
LQINITDKTDWVEFVIEDNGLGIVEKEEKSGGHKSMAMTIFKKRRKLIQQKYNKDFKFELINLRDENPEQSGVKVIIDIPIIDND